MLRPLESMQGYSILAEDGEIGRVDDFYFNDADWTVRYLVVNTGAWLVGRKVLISPMAVTGVDHDKDQVQLNLTRQRVKEAPGIETDRPVSRQYEIAYNSYYGWPPYWGGPYLWGPYQYPAALVPRPYQPPQEELTRREQSYDDNLRSFKEVNGYILRGTEEDVGDIEDMVVDDRSWEIRAVVADTNKWWAGKNVVVPLPLVKNIDYAQQWVVVKASRDQVKSLPEIRSWDDIPIDDAERTLEALGSALRREA